MLIVLRNITNIILSHPPLISVSIINLSYYTAKVIHAYIDFKACIYTKTSIQVMAYSTSVACVNTCQAPVTVWHFPDF